MSALCNVMLGTGHSTIKSLRLYEKVAKNVSSFDKAIHLFIASLILFDPPMRFLLGVHFPPALLKLINRLVAINIVWAIDFNFRHRSRDSFPGGVALNEARVSNAIFVDRVCLNCHEWQWSLQPSLLLLLVNNNKNSNNNHISWPNWALFSENQISDRSSFLNFIQIWFLFLFLFLFINFFFPFLVFCFTSYLHFWIRLSYFILFFYSLLLAKF